jgi:hypothetical protein
MHMARSVPPTPSADSNAMGCSDHQAVTHPGPVYFETERCGRLGPRFARRFAPVLCYRPSTSAIRCACCLPRAAIHRHSFADRPSEQPNNRRCQPSIVSILTCLP